MKLAQDHGNDTTFLEVRERVLSARENGTILCVTGGNTKNFLAPITDEEKQLVGKVESLSLPENTGIISYQPSELVITMRAATKLSDVMAALADENQMLGFEPPSFGKEATIGGTVASAVSGPARPYLGSVRDAILGIKIMTGTGEIARFGGEVMKNVAGYDVSRLFVGSMGSLGVLLEISLRVQPVPKAQSLLHLVCDEETALTQMARLRKMSLPISGMAYAEKKLHVRLSGSEIAVDQGQHALANFETDEPGFWQNLNEQESIFFKSSMPLWRLTLPFDVQLDCVGQRIWDWGGGLCWLKTDAPCEDVCEIATTLGGAATMFRGGAMRAQNSNEQIDLMRNKLKAAFDPGHVFLPRAAWRSAY